MRVAFSDVHVAGIDIGKLRQKLAEHQQKLERREAIEVLRELHRYKDGDRTHAIRLERTYPDWRDTVLVVTSSDPAAMVKAQDAAARLKEAINARGKGRDWHFAATLTDAIDVYHQACPLITIGVGESWETRNATIASFTEALPRDPASTETTRIYQDMDRGGRRVAIWGSSKEKVEEAVKLFISSGLLDRFLATVWEEG
jgi:hypothetical protein